MSTRMIRGMMAGFAALAVSAAGATAQQADDNEPVLSASYSWEDGKGTVLGTFGTISETANVSAEAGIVPNTGNRMLRITESPHASGAQQAYIAYIEHLEDGDIITASFFGFDDTPGVNPRLRIWAHYAVSGDPLSFSGSAGGADPFTTGIGWEELDHVWMFDSNNGQRDALVIEARVYSASCPQGETCSTDYYVDDVSVAVYCATNPDLQITFPDGTTIGNPLSPGQFCEPGKGDPGDPKDPPLLCEDPDIGNSYGWEDGKATIIGGQSIGNVTVENVTDFVHTGTNALKATETGHTSGARILYVAHLTDLTNGDIINAGFWAYDDTPGPGTAESPAGSVRIWARYTSGEGVGNTSAFPPGANNETFSSGVGWEEMSHSWTYDASLGDGVVIEARLYGSPATCPECSMDYWIDDLWVEVCSSNPGAVQIVFPDAFEPPKDPDPVDPPDPCDEPDVASTYDFSDGEGTALGHNFSNNITVENVTDFVHTGTNALKITESPNANGTPQIHLIHVRNLVDGDVVTGSFWTYDDTPGQGPSGYPSVRIWAHHTSGSSISSVSPAIPQDLQNTNFSSGIGWEKLEHSWEFDSNDGARDGLLIQARLFAPTCNDEHPGWDPQTEQCATEYWIDDLAVNVCSSNAENVVILFPDSAVVDPDPPIEMCEDPLWGAYGWEDGRGTAISTSNTQGNITLTNIHSADGPVNSGNHGLRINESPNVSGTPQIHIAFIENLQHGDTIRASVFAYDDTPGVNPVVRIWGRYAFTGDPFFPTQSAGGNDTPTSGIGWEEIEHTWEFDQGAGDPPRDAFLVHVRVYAPTCNDQNPTWDPITEECSTDYFVDDLLVEACGDHPNLTITFPDGTVIGDPAEPSKCLADVTGTGQIDDFDVLMVNGAWGSADPDADINGDGIVDGADLGIVLASFGPCDDFLFPMPGTATLILEDSALGGSTRQLDLFVELDANEALVNVYDATVTSSLGFMSGSLVTIGDPNHPGNFSVFEDTNFDFFAFSNGTHMGTNAGWYNNDPPNEVGLAGQYAGNRVQIASLIVDEATEFDAELSVTWRDGDGRARQATLSLDDDPTPACPGDLTGSGAVGVFDLLELLGQWGACADCNKCPADLTGNCSIGVFDLLELLGQWGPCPQ